MARLCVTYPLRRGESGKLVWRDDTVEGVIGLACIAAGVFIPTGDRDLEFRVTASKAPAMVAKLRALGFKCSMVPEDAEDPGLNPM